MCVHITGVTSSFSSYHVVNPTVSAGRRQPHVVVAIQLSTVFQRGCNNHWYHVVSSCLSNFYLFFFFPSSASPESEAECLLKLQQLSLAVFIGLVYRLGCDHSQIVSWSCFVLALLCPRDTPDGFDTQEKPLSACPTLSGANPDGMHFSLFTPVGANFVQKKKVLSRSRSLVVSLPPLFPSLLEKSCSSRERES